MKVCQVVISHLVYDHVMELEDENNVDFVVTLYLIKQYHHLLLVNLLHGNAVHTPLLLIADPA